MDINIKKTMRWSECKEILLPLAGKYLGKPKKGEPANFAKFVTAYPNVDCAHMCAFLERVSERNGIADITEIALVSEDCCLFSTEPGSALEVIAAHLNILNTGGRLPSLWFYLDCDEKAIVHFVNKSGWYAEAFFACNEDFSVMHLFDDGAASCFMPVVFTTDLERYIERAAKDGKNCLRQYLPRELYSFLSNKSGKKKKAAPPAPKRNPFPHEKGDLL